jgi:phosphate starvation-inducible PhoH-like protein
MTEKIIYLETIEPIDLYGVNNSNLQKIKELFPKTKIIGRGNEIKVIGEKSEIQTFEKRLKKLIEYFEKFNSISENTIIEIMNGNGDKISERKDNENILVYGTHGRLIKARTPNQFTMVEHYKTNDLLFAIGPAGTGKTYISIALAVRALRNKQVRKIVLTRPAVEAGERLGFLPGDFKEKLDPYLQPLYDALNDMIPSKKLAEFIEDKTIQIAPLAYMRGRTLSNAFVILDEAQNATITQLKMFLTRMGENAKFVVTGDITQIDLPDKRQSGLLQSKRLLGNIKGLSFIQFDVKDIIRHKLVRYIVNAYEAVSE